MTALANVLDDAQLGGLVRLILAYRNGEEVAPSAELTAVWALVKNQLDVDMAKYLEICEKRKEAVSKRWSNTKAYNCIQEYTNVYKCIHNDNDNVNDNDTDNDNVNDIKESKPKKASPVFRRPTIEEVEAYCTERRNGINAQDFIDYYDARGWKMSGGVSVKDWKARVRTWEKRRKVSTNTNNVNDFRDAY